MFNRDSWINGVFVFFYTYSILVAGAVQIKFLNEDILTIIFSLCGIYLVINKSLKFSLIYVLLFFPIAYEAILFTKIVPLLPNFFSHIRHNTIFFFGIYALILYFIYRHELIFVGVILFFIGLFINLEHVPGQLYQAVKYSTNGLTLQSKIRDQLGKIDSLETEAIYLICLDGYPNTHFLPDSIHSNLDQILFFNGFHEYPTKIYSNYTPTSVRELVTRNYQRQNFTSLNCMQIKGLMTQSLAEAGPKEDQVFIGSPLVNYVVSQPLFGVFLMPKLNHLILKFAKPYFSESNSVGSFEFFDQYHQGLLNQIDGQKKQIKVLHFLTFHNIQQYKPRELRKELAYADSLLIQILKCKNQQAPLAKFIIFSDHGERQTEGLNPRRAILYTNF